MTGPDALIGGRYRLVRRLAAGGMGTVWLATDERLERPVALKLLHPQPGLSAQDAGLVSKRAMREAQLTARLHHPHAVPVYDVVEHDSQPCLIMQYLPSTSLQAILDADGPMAPGEVARIGGEVASALAAAHQAGIVHRDVKPANVLIGEDGTAKLTDFGVSHAIGDTRLTSTGMVTGTPAYLAPEVARGADSSFASDVFSLGATLYAATEGAPPFGTDSNPMAVLHRVASGRPNPPTRSGPLAPLLGRMLAADPAQRPPMIDVARTLTALHTDMTAIATGRTEQRRPAGAAPVTPTAILPVTPAPPAGRPAAQSRAPRPPVKAVEPPARPTGPPPIGGRPARHSRLPVILLLGLLLVLTAVAIGIVLVKQSNSHRATTPSISRSPAASGPSTPVSRSTAPPSSTQPPTTQPATTPPTSKPKPSSTPPASPVAGTPTATQLTRAITDYYRLLPRNTDAGWARLTAQYQASHAQGRQAYDNFWSPIKRVRVSNLTGTPPGTVEAVITYFFNDGRVIAERTQFGLVSDGGVLKIDSSSVLGGG